MKSFIILSIFFFCFVTLASNAFAFEKTIPLPTSGGTFEYTLDLVNNMISARVTQQATGWSAIGLNSVGSTMPGASIIMAYPSGNQVNGYTASGFSMPSLSGDQTFLTGTEVVQSGSNIVFNFTRPFNVNGLFTITNTDIQLLYALSNTAPNSPSSFSKHTTRDSMTVNLFTYGESASSSPADASSQGSSQAEQSGSGSESGAGSGSGEPTQNSASSIAVISLFSALIALVHFCF